MSLSSPVMSLDDDVVLKIFSFLHIPEITSLRQTCRRFYLASRLRIVWTDFCASEILGAGYPFPDVPLESLPVDDLERMVRHAHGLATRWRNDALDPQTIGTVQMGTGTAASVVRFLPGRGGRWLLTISKGIWSIVTLWRIDAPGGLRKACEWSPRRALIDGFALNKDTTSDVAVALSLRFQQDDQQVVQLLALREEGKDVHLEEVLNTPLETTFKPTLLDGNILALSDDLASTIILDWKQGLYATLEQPNEENGLLTHDSGVLVELARQSVLVVRARSVHLFPYPVLRPRDKDPLTYRPHASHSFGWVDGVGVQILRRLGHPWLSILVRPECDDPWTVDARGLDLYTLTPNPAADDDDGAKAPSYLFPPVLVERFHSSRGPLRCTDLVMGRCATAVWVQPPDYSSAGLLFGNDDGRSLQNNVPSLNSHETMMAGAFTGPLGLGPGGGQVPATRLGRMLFQNPLNDWTSLDYDEELGRIAFGSSGGSVKVVQL
ncbi:hypothetical protein BD626DRAFT_476498 [Schizophyllum amplum]|uniref:F-box domain-containing protein n=1 Tax=Schizophyllum amplum TaxID=97359 RepID=A0A550CZF0_9AGAR|nr:hypothetical protein BD626DRAFT_476498 [Auriculariopsis ampla]